MDVTAFAFVLDGLYLVAVLVLLAAYGVLH